LVKVPRDCVNCETCRLSNVACNNLPSFCDKSKRHPHFAGRALSAEFLDFSDG
jgi:hypothetical protein